ncbi:hypothetical protein [Geobacter sp. AOG1]|uniref:hypothetical protein n=1 Tax=Geobacter sp. AOG1 TaxID=1566346 RepID=UPI001CC64875|nr:hypothetical protein [Geobacter sp. AOG1]GFE56816.1 hypothetical protein AOG1_06950 [Geobacter sp. AOG1]
MNTVVSPFHIEDRPPEEKVNSATAERVNQETPTNGDEHQRVGELTNKSDQAQSFSEIDEFATVSKQLQAHEFSEHENTGDDPISALQKELQIWVAEGNDKAAVLSKALDWNRANGDALTTEDIVAIVEELTEKPVGEVPPLTPRDLLFKLAEDMILFNDDQSKPYFFYEGEAFSAPSVHVKNRLTHHFLIEMEDLPPKKDLNAVLNILESRARFDGPRISLMNRVASSDAGIFYDLRDKRYVKVTSDGWEIVPSFPLFRRYQHLQPQKEPISGGDPWAVFKFLTVPEESQLLVMVYIISLFVPKIAHPVFAVCGDQGSSKSFFCTVINRLVDPTLTERVIQPKNERDLVQTLRQKYVTVLDNLSKIDNRVSDIFCQVCTGGSVSYRQLYTDEGENIAQFRHVVILNSINLAIINADLMDRSIILKLRRIDPLDRKPEHELWEAFEASRASILGGIFDTVAKAMAIYPEVEVEHLPRLADFAKWGYAIAEALGKSGDQFLNDFSQNVKHQNESVVEKNVLCQTVLTLMAEGKPYLAKVSDAHETLKSIAKRDAKDETFPKLPHHLRPSLDRLRASLLEHGVSYQFMERGSSGVRILFTKVDSSDTPPPAESSTGSVLAIEDEAGEPGEAAGELPEIQFDEMPEAISA